MRRSGHKYGLTYAGLGWIIFRNEEQLPSYLKFELHYLGGTSFSLGLRGFVYVRILTVGTEETYTLNFSRPGNQVIAQYFSFIRLGWNGYQNVMRQDLANARLLSNALESTQCPPPTSHPLYLY